MIKIKIHPSSALWLGGLIAIGVKNPAGYFLPIVFHELCHVAAAILLKRKIAALTLGASGLLIDIKGVLSYAEQLVISASGPLGSLLLYALLRNVYPSCALISLALGIINLIPFSTFDGRGILYPALCSILPSDKCERAFRVIDVLGVAALMLFATSALVLTRYNASVLFIAIYMFALTFLKNDGIF